MKEAPFTYLEDSNTPDVWRCFCCEEDFTDDTELVTRDACTGKGSFGKVLVCLTCVTEFDEDNS
jgi:hypothetical protein